MLLCADSLASTHAIAATLSGLARVGDLIVLAGEMGAGKTAFAQGFGRALGITEAITSPTFTLVHSYPCPDGRTTLHHADLYRLESTGDVEDLALNELAEFDGIVLVEWGDVAANGLGDHLEVRLSASDRARQPTDPSLASAADDEEFELDLARVIEVQAVGRSWAGRWDRLIQAFEVWRC